MMAVAERMAHMEVYQSAQACGWSSSDRRCGNPSRLGVERSRGTSPVDLWGKNTNHKPF